MMKKASFQNKQQSLSKDYHLTQFPFYVHERMNSQTKNIYISFQLLISGLKKIIFLVNL